MAVGKSSYSLPRLQRLHVEETMLTVLSRWGKRRDHERAGDQGGIERSEKVRKCVHSIEQIVKLQGS